MAFGEKTVGDQTSAFPTSLKVFPPQTQSNDPATENPDLAEGREANDWSAEIEAIEFVLGPSPRGSATVASTTITIGAFKTVDGSGVVSCPGGTVSLTASTLNYIYFDMVTPILAKSTVGWPATKHVPLATWPGSGTTLTDMRPHLPSAAMPPVAHASSHIRGAPDQIDGDLIDIDAAPSGYTPSTAGAPGGASSTEHLAAHLKGIGDALGGKASTTHASTHATGGADPLDGDGLEMSRSATNYTPSGATIAGHLGGVDTALGGKAATSHSHVTSDVIGGTFADARIASSSVTQHQAALSIAASQLTGDIAIARLAVALLLSAKGDILGHSGSAFAKLAAGTNGYLLTADSGETTGLKWAASGLGAVQIQGIALYQDQKAQNTSGGTLTSGAWRRRDINTEVFDTQNIGSVTSDQVTLAAGTYVVLAMVPYYNCLRSQAKLYNATDAADIAFSTSDYGATTVSGRDVIFTKFTLAGSKAIEIQHQGQSDSGTRGFGVEANFGTEVYSQLLILKVSA